MPTALVLLLLLLIGSGLGTLFPISTVCMQNAVTQHQMGVATGAANFFRSLFSALVVAVLGAIVLGGLGGVTGMSVEMLARAASAHELALCVPLRVHGLRAGARLRHGVPDRDGGARAQGPGDAGGGSAHRPGDADPGGIKTPAARPGFCLVDRSH